MNLVECVPNISEGKDKNVIDAVAAEIESVDGARLLDVDPGAATNRTVITFVGTSNSVKEAAFRLIRKAAELIDMRNHSGEHARNGATDVCPFVPIGDTSMTECVEIARELGERVGSELGIPVYLYEEAATKSKWRNLANIRAGEYEALKDKLGKREWKPDFGPNEFGETVARTGATQIGARQFLVAYNINLNTKEKKYAKRIGLMIREQGGAVIRDKNGKKTRGQDGKFQKHKKGLFKKCNATGWFIEEYGVAQVTMNLTDFHITPPHIVFDKVCELSDRMGVRVIGSEIVGLVPLEAIRQAGRYYLAKQKMSTGVPEWDLVETAVQSMGLSQISRFVPSERIIEYSVAEERPLITTSISAFADELSRKSPAPGGGSVAALAGALSAGLVGMVANLTVGKSGYGKVRDEMLKAADAGQYLKDRLLSAVDDDTFAFNKLMECFGMPNGPDKEIAIAEANRNATLVPLSVIATTLEVLKIADIVQARGNQNSLSDAGVAVLAARTAAMGAYYNVLINLAGIKDNDFKKQVKTRADTLIKKIEKRCDKLEAGILKKLKNPIN
ncbi:MAG: glutamate formimidoyltransferase [Proteobacteria bacterium]|nr:glutamate formimidoyltransferase [Pseudomonadota bacterium]